jgi:hypothetical protein
VVHPPGTQSKLPSTQAHTPLSVSKTWQLFVGPQFTVVWQSLLLKQVVGTQVKLRHVVPGGQLTQVPMPQKSFEVPGAQLPNSSRQPGVVPGQAKVGLQPRASHWQVLELKPVPAGQAARQVWVLAQKFGVAAGHWHAPLTQLWPPVQMWPQAPQLFGFVCRLTQVPAQQLVPPVQAWHAAPPLPQAPAVVPGWQVPP